MWDIYKNCAPKDNDNWSFGMLFCWLIGGIGFGLGAMALFDNL